MTQPFFYFGCRGLQGLSALSKFWLSRFGTMHPSNWWSYSPSSTLCLLLTWRSWWRMTKVPMLCSASNWTLMQAFNLLDALINFSYTPNCQYRRWWPHPEIEPNQYQLPWFCVCEISHQYSSPFHQISVLVRDVLILYKEMDFFSLWPPSRIPSHQKTQNAIQNESTWALVSVDGDKGEGTSEKRIIGWNPGGKLQDKENKYLHDLKTHEGHDCQDLTGCCVLFLVCLLGKGKVLRWQTWAGKERSYETSGLPHSSQKVRSDSAHSAPHRPVTGRLPQLHLVTDVIWGGTHGPGPATENWVPGTRKAVLRPGSTACLICSVKPSQNQTV